MNIAPSTTLLVTAEEAGMRLDRFLRHKIPGLPHSWIAKTCRKGQILVDTEPAEIATRVTAGQSVELRTNLPHIDIEATKERRPPPKQLVQDLAQGVLYEDSDIIILNKPAGLAVQGGSNVTWSVDDCLPLLAQDGMELRLVHRLDKETSGLLVIAKTRQAAVAYTGYFRGREVEKTYLALVLGVPPAEGLIDMPLYKTGRAGTQRVIPSPQGESAQTEYRRLDRAGKEVSLMQLTPYTGRTHQLRVHMAHLAEGHPILGDMLYQAHQHPATEQLRPLLGNRVKKLHLHAWRLSLPTANGIQTITAPLPVHLQESLDQLGLLINI